jgi:hypothetical protein
MIMNKKRLLRIKMIHFSFVDPLYPNSMEEMNKNFLIFKEFQILIN